MHPSSTFVTPFVTPFGSTQRSESASHTPLCACLALDRSRPGHRAADGARAQFPSRSNFSRSRPTAAPWLLLSVYVRWGGDPSPVVNIYNPDSSSHPTHHRATRRGETPGWRGATCVCLPARAPPEGWRAGGMVTGESDQAGARCYAPNGTANPAMKDAITDEGRTNRASRRRL